MRLDVTKLKAIPILEVATNSLGRLVGRVALDRLRAETISEINALPVEVEQLVWLLLLNNGWGKYGLHTFLSGSGGDFAPQVLASLTEAGMGGRAEVFAQAMQVFGAPYPTDQEERKPYFGWRQPGCDNPLRSSDYELFRLSTAFGTEEEYQAGIETFIRRTPELDAGFGPNVPSSARTTASAGSPGRSWTCRPGIGRNSTHGPARTASSGSTKSLSAR